MLKITESLTSRQNPKIKNLIRLQKHSERLEQDVFLVEGVKEIEKAVISGYEFESVYFTPAIIKPDAVKELLGKSVPEQVYEVNNSIFNKIAYRETSGGIVVLARPKLHDLNLLSSSLSENPLLLVIEGVEKPGNIGAIYRTADAAGVDGIILCDSKPDLYNPNIIRASLGCVFTKPTAITSSHNAIEWLKKKKINIYSTYLHKAVPYTTLDFTQSSAIVMGTEATGISDAWLNASDTNIIIPMSGSADSMNVSTSAAVIIFEARRQRNLQNLL